jgi:hypothetical protein
MLQVVELETIKALNSLNNNLKVVIAGAHLFHPEQSKGLPRDGTAVMWRVCRRFFRKPYSFI